jgi:hypothetical protein
MTYIFKLREDLPRGFKENNQYPELPAIYSVLKEYDGKEIEFIGPFEIELDTKFLKYLQKNKVPIGQDPKLREGLRVELVKKQLAPPNDKFKYQILTRATNSPGVCVFGGLEEKFNS